MVNQLIAHRALWFKCMWSFWTSFVSLATPLAALLIPIAPHHIQPGSCTDLWPGGWLLDWLCGSCPFTIPLAAESSGASASACCSLQWWFFARWAGSYSRLTGQCARVSCMSASPSYTAEASVQAPWLGFINLIQVRAVGSWLKMLIVKPERSQLLLRWTGSQHGHSSDSERSESDPLLGTPIKDSAYIAGSFAVGGACIWCK